METCTVILSANAGISLTFGAARIWIDAVHQTKTPPFSTVAPALWWKLQTHELFASPDFLFFTHCHGDHYSRALAENAKTRWPQAKLILPEPEFEGQLLLDRPEVSFQARGLTFRFFRLPHEGAQYASVPHYGLLLSDGDFQILVAGDCEVASPVLAERLHGSRVDLAILDFPWLTLRKGRAFIDRVIRPEHLLVYHLPFAEDDDWGYRTATRKAARLLPEVPDVRLLENALQVEVI